MMIQPRPLGILAEYTVGKGPEYNSTLDSIMTQNLRGEFVTISYRKEYKGQVIQPYIRFQNYDGGKKMERDARSYIVKEWEAGIEWIPVRNFELTLAYLQSQRQYSDRSTPKYDESGHLMRLQLQFNY
jgi:phosphate-selective porin